MARQCYYAGVVECRRADYQMPHFLFFTNKTSREYEERDAAPTLGYFALYEQGDPKLPPDFKFPMGAMIVHDNSN